MNQAVDNVTRLEIRGLIILNNIITTYYSDMFGSVYLVISDLLSRKVETFINNEQQAGCHKVNWNADNKSTGAYFYKIQAGDYTETRKMLLLK